MLIYWFFSQYTRADKKVVQSWTIFQKIFEFYFSCMRSKFLEKIISYYFFINCYNQTILCQKCMKKYSIVRFLFNFVKIFINFWFLKNFKKSTFFSTRMSEYTENKRIRGLKDSDSEYVIKTLKIWSLFFTPCDS